MNDGTTPTIEANGVRKSHGDFEVLRGVSLAVSRGEVAAIIGPSGCGKSTFLRCLNGLETFHEGSVSMAGHRLNGTMDTDARKRSLLEIRRRVGMVFQSFNLFPHLTALENVMEAPLCVLGKPRAEAEASAAALLDRVGLGGVLNARPGRLSGGQQQRVAIARALAMQPEAILFDEPTSALDPVMACEVLEVMADLAAAGQTMLVVTHSMNFARKVASAVHLFESGVIIESGPSDQFFREPRTEAARAFLASALAA